MSIVRHQLFVRDTPGHGADFVPVLRRPSGMPIPKWLIILCAFFLLPTTMAWSGETGSVNQEELLTTIREYAHAVGKGDRVAAGQRDFVCLLKMAQQQLLVDGNFPDALSPIYEWCA